MKDRWELRGTELSEGLWLLLSTMCCGREGRAGTLQSCLSLLGCPSGHPGTCALLAILVSQHLCLQSRITAAVCLEKQFEI